MHPDVDDVSKLENINDDEPKASAPLTIASIIERLGTASQQDQVGVAEAIRNDLMLRDGLATLTVHVSDLLPVVNSNLGYLCGYLPTEYANKLLAWLDVAHPVFGKQINATADEAFQAGRRIAEDYDARKRKQEALERKKAKAAEGLIIPEPDEVVTSEDASKLLEAIRAKRDEVTKAKADKEAAEDEAKKTDIMKSIAAFKAAASKAGMF